MPPFRASRINIPKFNYTGEGFKGEKTLAFITIGLTIVSTLLLIHVSLLQRRQLKNEIAESERKKNGQNNGKNNDQKT